MRLTVRQMLEHMELMIGQATNYFTMSRGSFRYTSLPRWRRRLIPVGHYEKEYGFDIAFYNPRKETLHTVKVEINEGRYKVTVHGDEENVNRWWITLPSLPDEHFYGCGETYSVFDLKGERARIFVAEHQNTDRISRKIIRSMISGPQRDEVRPFREYESYYVQPTAVSSNHYCIHAETNTYSEFDFRNDYSTTLHFQEEPVFWMQEEENFHDISKDIASIHDCYGSLPEWIHDGVILAVQEGCGAVERKVRTAKDAGVLVNGVWSQDWCGCRRTGFGYQVMWNWEADETLYPDLKNKIAEWKQEGVHFLGYINPFMAIEKDLYRYASERGWCVKDRDGNDYLVTITTFPAAMIDFTNPEAYDWYKNLIKENMIGIGMSGWMADFGEYLPVDCVLYSGQDPYEMHNQWPAIWAKMNREAVEECGKKDEIFFFTRAGYTGSLGNTAMMWTGDQHVDWSKDDGLPSVIPASLSLAMSGQCITHSDAGGYTTVLNMTRSAELLARWQQMNVFTPLFRMHEGNQPSRNVQFDHDRGLLRNLAYSSKLHAALKPYLLKLMKEAEQGIPMMRPLFYEYEELWEEKEEYLLGKDILVAPVLTDKTVSREVRLPHDVWIDLYTGKEYTEGTYIIHTGVHYIPVLIRKNREMLDDETLNRLKEILKVNW